jgi:RimJ/RimL family protein N-acetyltransferase
MQQSWRLDGDKLTFIACLLAPSHPKEVEVVGGKDDADENMIGDVNLFLFEDDEDDEDIESVEKNAKGVNVIGELEIMIARTDLQGNGYGTAVLSSFTWYILSELSPILSEFTASLPAKPTGTPSLKYLRVKIDAENERSIKLFEKVGFMKVSEKPNYFGELELRLDVSRWEGTKVEQKIAVYRLNSNAASEETPMVD